MAFNPARCHHCKGKLEQGQRIHPDCIEPWALAQEEKAKRKAEKQAKTAAKVDRAATRRKLDAIKTIPTLIKEAQHAFNAYIRFRDRDRPCISCGKNLSSDAVGGGFDCGHYRSRGAAGHLRFHPSNAHGQCKHCNRWGAGRVQDFRLGLVERIGKDAVERLEADNSTRKWERQELIEIKMQYREKLKALKKEAGEL